MPPVGFSLGSIYKLSQKKISDESLKFMLDIGCDAVELGCYNIKEIKYVFTLDYQLRSKFRHFSLHAPYTGFSYDNSIQTRGLKRTLLQVNDMFNIDLICIHPDLVEKWDEINGYQKLPLALENMDNKKSFGRTIEELNSLPIANWGIVLDLLHCYLIDPSMDLARDMIEEFGDKIGEFHVSGSREGYHAPLFIMKQKEILIPEAVKHGAPLILEGVLDSYSEAEMELIYLRSLVRKLL